jgi:hypothetical protein
MRTRTTLAAAAPFAAGTLLGRMTDHGQCVTERPETR